MSENTIYFADLPQSRAVSRRPTGFLLAFIKSATATIAMWHRRASTRAILQHLEHHRLDDIGLSCEQRDVEVRKPFWIP